MPWRINTRATQGTIKCPIKVWDIFTLTRSDGGQCSLTFEVVLVKQYAPVF